MVSTSFWSAEGKPISVEELMNILYGALPAYFSTEDELRKIWSDPITPKTLLEKLADTGYGQAKLGELQKLVDAENSDLFVVLEYIAFCVQPITRDHRATLAKPKILDGLNQQQADFLEFVLFKYIDSGVEELDQSRLPNLIELKYHSIADTSDILGGVPEIRSLFLGFQKHLYQTISFES